MGRLMTDIKKADIKKKTGIDCIDYHTIDEERFSVKMSGLKLSLNKASDMVLSIADCRGCKPLSGELQLYSNSCVL